MDEWRLNASRAGNTLALIANQVLDWYRFYTDDALIRRIPLYSVRSYNVQDDFGRIGSSVLGWVPGEAAENAGESDPAIVESIQKALVRIGSIPIWKSLYLDAQAELLAGELRSAVLLANAAMETLVNFAFRSIASEQEI